ncbi:hypothetical protein [Blastococcus brunescens]|uniref:Mandelate racemase/muconate lactonizing enzyme N-terminal domain-containing protein n=1 Tax=Blastococcus brunescens TaxID=1564165 RepID=A0ABZ1AUN5_9ACTN|nr:hypothetical protein [Blastococcus sp. BMG 8361]WRL62293.1 hypothetical protein U6N30_19930 [Blastococcus sp. BMG 8361]
MHIIKTESWILRLPFVRTSRDFDDAHHELIGVTLHTDTGQTGTGFAFVTDFGGGVAVKALLDDVLLPACRAGRCTTARRSGTSCGGSPTAWAVASTPSRSPRSTSRCGTCGPAATGTPWPRSWDR